MTKAEICGQCVDRFCREMHVRKSLRGHMLLAVTKKKCPLINITTECHYQLEIMMAEQC
jgi:hypothetical protein